MESLLQFDERLLLFLNGAHTKFMDFIMITFTSVWPWIPLYIVVIGYIFHTYGYKRKKIVEALFLIIFLFVLFAITDMGSSAIKKIVQRSRPGHLASLEGVVRLLDGKGGAYGFFSSHAANVFGFAIYSSKLILKNWYTYLIFIWASLVSYSRIYVGRHYPSDVMVGALFGLIFGYLIHKIVQKTVLNGK